MSHNIDNRGFDFQTYDGGGPTKKDKKELEARILNSGEIAVVLVVILWSVICMHVSLTQGRLTYRNKKKIKLKSV